MKLLVPTTYMNRSGSAVAATKNYFRISTQEILLVHDETAFDLGKCRLKQGGGANGHNGLIDIIRMLGSDSSFSRLRIGVGQPMTSAHLSKFLTVKELTREERKLWLQSSDLDRDTLRWIIEGDFQKAMTRLHSRGNNIDASTLTDSDR